MTERAARDPTTTHEKPGWRAHAAALSVALVVAAFLLFAAYMKLTSRPFSALPLKDALIAPFEIVIAIGLLVTHRKWWAWMGVGALFAAFSGVTLHLLLTGAGSCGCFGALTIPPAATLTLDAVIVAAALGVALALGARPVRLTLAGACVIPFVVAGAMFSKTVSPPPAKDFKPGGAYADLRADAAQTGDAPSATAAPDEFDPLQLGASGALLLLPRVAHTFLDGAPPPDWLATLAAAADASAVAPEAPATLVFVYDPFCEVCMRFHPLMEQYTHDEEANAANHLRVILVQKSELEAFDIPEWAWPKSPTVVLIHRGRIVHEWGGEETPNPFLLHDDIAARGGAHLRELRETYVPLIAR